MAKRKTPDPEVAEIERQLDEIEQRQEEFPLGDGWYVRQTFPAPCGHTDIRDHGPFLDHEDASAYLVRIASPFAIRSEVIEVNDASPDEAVFRCNGCGHVWSREAYCPHCRTCETCCGCVQAKAGRVGDLGFSDNPEMTRLVDACDRARHKVNGGHQD